ncbi:Adenylate kinase, active site lid [Musa troglodytarum]|uniref:adenylate kinase n=1 Tax=Musa troglodytarum TaxID=320322 RepID=A0A9E7HZW1_9LILI|nr:Adenylate kinase, active site lid [Musa troglodytarum]
MAALALSSATATKAAKPSPSSPSLSPPSRNPPTTVCFREPHSAIGPTEATRTPHGHRGSRRPSRDSLPRSALGISACLLRFGYEVTVWTENSHLDNSVECAWDEKMVVVAIMKREEPLKVMISGAPASGKGTQCELIKKKVGEGSYLNRMYQLVHIAAGDLLRAEIAAGTERGKRAKEYMEKGMLVPDEIVVMMVKERLLQPDAQENGWLLDGYPRSFSQAKALEDLGIRPDIFILLDASIPPY